MTKGDPFDFCTLVRTAFLQSHPKAVFNTEKTKTGRPKIIGIKSLKLRYTPLIPMEVEHAFNLADNDFRNEVNELLRNIPVRLTGYDSGFKVDWAVDITEVSEIKRFDDHHFFISAFRFKDA